MVFRQVPSHVASSGPTSLDPALMSGALSTLLQVYEATLSQDIDAFEPFALRCLGRLIGFDGAVWGSGRVAPGRIAELSITRASVVDRPATLSLTDLQHRAHRQVVEAARENADGQYPGGGETHQHPSTAIGQDAGAIGTHQSGGSGAPRVRDGAAPPGRALLRELLQARATDRLAEGCGNDDG